MGMPVKIKVKVYEEIKPSGWNKAMRFYQAILMRNKLWSFENKVELHYENRNYYLVSYVQIHNYVASS